MKIILFLRLICYGWIQQHEVFVFFCIILTIKMIYYLLDGELPNLAVPRLNISSFNWMGTRICL